MNAIQTLIDAANPGDTVVVPGMNYMIDAINAPIRVTKALTLDLRPATILTLPNAVNDQVYFPIGIWACQDVTVLLGDVVGERDGHSGISTFGYGIGIGGGATNIVLRFGRVRDCMADGVLIADARTVEIDQVIKTHNRRQGVTVSAVDGLRVHDGESTLNGGVAPGAGIDLEADPGKMIHNVQIYRERFSGNAGAGVLINTPKAQRSGITVTSDCTFVGKPIDGTDGITPWWAKLIGPWTNWFGYPRSLLIPITTGLALWFLPPG